MATEEKKTEQNIKKTVSATRKTEEQRRMISRQKQEEAKARRKKALQIRIGIAAGAVLLTGVLIWLLVRGKGSDSGSEESTVISTETSSSQSGTEAVVRTDIPEHWTVTDGKTYYTDASGNPVTNKIITEDGKKYFFGPDGALVTGTGFLRDGQAYTADSAGVLSPASGWILQEGIRYFAEEGSLCTDRIITEEGASYYLDLSGRLVTGQLVSTDGYLYRADDEGILTKVSGWQEQDGKRYYAEPDGRVYTSQSVTIDGETFFMDQYGAVVPGTPTLDQYLGSRHLLNWMETHFNDYYFKTPYDGIWTHLEDPEALLRPYGEYGESGGMNCAGFVSHLIQSTGGDLEKVTAMELPGGYIDADSYLYLGLRDYVQCKSYDSLEEFLASGEAKKGDILYLAPDKTENENADCHLGIFWGETPSENLLWSQAQDTGCGVTEIRMLNPIKKIYLLPVDGN